MESTSNPLNNTYNDLETAPDTSVAEALQELLPHAKVVIVFNIIFAGDLYHPLINGQQVDSLLQPMVRGP